MPSPVTVIINRYILLSAELEEIRFTILQIALMYCSLLICTAPFPRLLRGGNAPLPLIYTKSLLILEGYRILAFVRYNGQGTLLYYNFHAEQLIW